MSKQSKFITQEYLSSYWAKLVSFSIIFVFGITSVNWYVLPEHWGSWVIILLSSLWFAFVLSHRLHESFKEGITIEEERKLEIMENIPCDALDRINIETMVTSRLSRDKFLLENMIPENEDKEWNVHRAKMTKTIENETSRINSLISSVRKSRN